MESKLRRRDPAHTRRSLKIAARNLFNTEGYFATDSNRIARAAGFAPGSFYRHFTDKLEIFIEVYRDWHWEHMQELERALSLTADNTEISIQMSEIILHFYGQWKIFRASIRMIELTVPQLSAFKNQRRVELVDLLVLQRKKLLLAPRSRNDLVTFILVLECLADAHLDGEYTLAGLSDEASKEELAALIGDFIAAG